MKEITNITPDGITYLDDVGNKLFIDFEICHQKNLMDIETRMGSKFTDEEKEFWQRAKYVGVRYALSKPPSVEFYATPPTKFKFKTRVRLSEVLSRIKKAGWRTNDGE